MNGKQLIINNDSVLATEIVTASLGQPVETITPLVGKGSVNLVFLARTAHSDTIVRLCRPEDLHRALSFYEKERWCLEQAAALGIPSPAVLAVGVWGERPYMLQQCVPGINGAECSTDQPRLWQALGHYARLIHSLQLAGFGEAITDFHTGQGQAGWQRWVDYNLASLTADDALLRLQVYAPAQRESIRQCFLGLRTRPLRIGLNHGDLTPRNTVLDEAGTIYLLDWGCAEAHLVPHYDLLELLRWHAPQGEIFQAFCRGYGLGNDDLAVLLPELQSLALLKAFDLTRWAIDRCPQRIAEIAERARAVAQQTVG